MSVIVKGMKMPEACAKFEDGEFVHCPFVNTDDDCILQDKITGTWEDMYQNCPLLELPEKHGRLVDADALIDGYRHMGYDPNEHPEESYMEGWCKGFNSAVDHCMGHVIYTPTIIEAEGNEE